MKMLSKRLLFLGSTVLFFLLGQSVNAMNIIGHETSVIPKADTVIIKRMQFHPSEITIKKGEIIVWINKDVVEHDVTEDVPDNPWGGESFKPGESYTFKPQESAHYICSIHPTMKGQIIVE